MRLAPRQALTPAPYALALPGLYTQQNATSPNLIGGYSGNFISNTVAGGTIDGGATISTGSAYELGGTIGQPDTGTMSGGTYSFGGGFWAFATNVANTVQK